MSYDRKCEDLAWHFLFDENWDYRQEDLRDLAQTIQDSIEDWFSGRQVGDETSEANTSLSRPSR